MLEGGPKPVVANVVPGKHGTRQVGHVGYDGQGVWDMMGSDATSYDSSRLKLELSWVLIQVEPRLAESILSTSTST